MTWSCSSHIFWRRGERNLLGQWDQWDLLQWLLVFSRWQVGRRCPWTALQSQYLLIFLASLPNTESEGNQNNNLTMRRADLSSFPITRRWLQLRWRGWLLPGCWFLAGVRRVLIMSCNHLNICTFDQSKSWVFLNKLSLPL